MTFFLFVWRAVNREKGRKNDHFSVGEDMGVCRLREADAYYRCKQSQCFYHPTFDNREWIQEVLLLLFKSL